MITKNPMQLKAFIKNKAAEKHISESQVSASFPVSICGQAFFPLGLNRNNSSCSAAQQRKLPSGSLAIWKDK